MVESKGLHEHDRFVSKRMAGKVLFDAESPDSTDVKKKPVGVVVVDEVVVVRVVLPIDAEKLCKDCLSVEIIMNLLLNLIGSGLSPV